MGLAAVTTFRLRYTVEDTDRHGNVRIYFRRPGQKKVRLRGTPGSDEFMADYRAAFAGTLQPRPTPGKTPAGAGTLRWLCERYFVSAAYKRLDPSTRAKRRAILDAICLDMFSADTPMHGEKPFALMKPRHVRRIRDAKAETPEAANGRIKALRILFAFAIEEDLAEQNPAKEVPRFRTGSTGFHTWTPEEVSRYEATHPIGTKARLALALLLFTGVRKSDVTRLGRQHARDGVHTFTQHKNRNRKIKRLSLPILPELQTVIDASATGDLTYLVTEHGKAFTDAGFGNRMRKWCDAAGLPHCTAHGLRKAGATIAADNGASERQLMAIFGWESSSDATGYTRAANQKHLAESAMHMLIRDETENEGVPPRLPGSGSVGQSRKKAQ